MIDSATDVSAEQTSATCRSTTLLSEARAPDFALMTIPTSAAHEGPDGRAFTAGFRSLIAALPSETHLLIGCHRRCRDRVAAWVEDRAGPLTLVPLDDTLDFSVWGQDACLAARDGVTGELVLLTPASPRRSADAEAVSAIAASAGIACQTADFAFEAGNLLIGDGFVLAGEDASASRDGLAALAGGRAVHFAGTAEAAPARSIRLIGSDGKPWVEERFAGTGRMQPVFHLDMFVSPAG